MLSATWLLLCVTLVGLLVFPLTAHLLPDLPLRGWPVSRFLGLLLLTYCSWLLAAAFPGRLVFWGALALIGLPCAWLWIRRFKQLVRAFDDRRRLLQTELVFAGCYLLLCVFKAFTGDLTSGEKYMDLGFVNSIILKPQVPPQDVWFAGQPLNYYYLGHWQLAALSIVANLDSLVVYTLAIALIGALYAQLAWFLVQVCIGARRGLAGGALVLWFVLLCGTPGAVANLVAAAYTPGVPLVSEATFVAPTLQIVDPAPIAGPNNTEFPAYTLLLGDPHAHVLGIPLVLGGIALLAQRYLRATTGRRAGPAYTAAWYTSFSVVLGCSYATNSFDVPLLAGLLVLTEAGIALSGSDSALRRWGGALLRVGATLACSVLAVWPFHATFQPFVLPAEHMPYVTALPGALGGIFAFTPVATRLAEFLAVNGFAVLILAAVFVVQLALRRAGAVVWLVWLSGLPFLFWRPIFVVLIPLLLLALYLAATVTDATRIAYALAAVALVLWLGPDVVMIRDLTERRLNTVFKWYFQANLLLSVALPVLVVASAQQLPRRAALALGTALAGVVVFSSLYVPVAVSYLVTANGSRLWGLDGLAQLAAYHPDEAAAIRWLRQQPDSDGVLEISGERTDGESNRMRTSRVSAYTGRPTALGWNKHVWLWHNLVTGGEEQRAFYTADSLQAKAYQGDVNSLQAACSYGSMRYVYFGGFERRPSGGKLDLAALPAGLTAVFESPGVTIYRCPEVTAAIASVRALYDEERSEYGRSYWLQGPDAQLHVYSATPGVVLLETGMFSAGESRRVDLQGDGETSAGWTVGTQRRDIHVLLPVGAGVSEWQLTVQGEPSMLSAQDTRSATIGVDALSAARVEAEPAGTPVPDTAGR